MAPTTLPIISRNVKELPTGNENLAKIVSPERLKMINRAYGSSTFRGYGPAMSIVFAEEADDAELQNTQHDPVDNIIDYGVNSIRRRRRTKGTHLMPRKQRLATSLSHTHYSTKAGRTLKTLLMNEDYSDNEEDQLTEAKAKDPTITFSSEKLEIRSTIRSCHPPFPRLSIPDTTPDSPQYR